ncbi:hypothetical protein RI129_012575 [Pyrocoelia pectoralis]|uniref:alpha-glucosidase n=1 Tax=Pyrocoelia pectoralis TaxID=417401 RepID=A0AAN7UTP8_9COLE
MFRAKFVLLLALNSLIYLLLAAEPNLEWWKNAVFYQIYPRSFMVSYPNCFFSSPPSFDRLLQDSNNDGIGDLKGIQSKLDHLVDAGVTALWLSPIYKSPQIDHGYDISDYRDVDSLFGTLDDFKSLLAEAHNKGKYVYIPLGSECENHFLGLKVILDFVPNHTSDEHDWFKRSLVNESKYADYYVWREGRNGNKDPPNNWISYFHGPAWTFNEARQLWYLHQFAKGQPDLNYRSSDLVKEMKDVLTYWLDLGVDGFRVDIISALFEDEQFRNEDQSNLPNVSADDREYLIHTYTEDQPETYDMVYQWRILLDDYQREKGGDARVMMTESYAPLRKLFGYYGNETHDGAHFTFNFWFITELNVESSAHDIKFVIDKWLTYMPWRHTANWVLGNHDQHRVASRYGSKRVDGLCMLSMLLPGVAVTYNGEEIGMEDGEVTWTEAQDPQACNGKEKDFLKNSRDFQRTPYQWNGSTNAGFNKGAKPWLPVGSKYQTVNLATEKTDTKSHYGLYQQVVKLRKRNTLKYGDMATIAFSDSVLGLTSDILNTSSAISLDAYESLILTTS